METYENNKITGKFEMKNGKEHGAAYLYYPSGKVKIKATYNNGTPISATEYYEDGRVKEAPETSNSYTSSTSTSSNSTNTSTKTFTRHP